MYNTVRSSRLYEQIVDQIINLIQIGELSSGDRLPSERELATQFGVSRTAVREAVKALRERGVIDIQPGRGTFILDPTQSASEIILGSLSLMINSNLEDSTNNLIQVRAILEPDIAALAAENATEEERLAMQAVVDRMDTLLEDAEGFIAADQEFHALLSEATHNRLIPILFDPIVELLQEQRRLIFTAVNGAEHGQAHHKKILAAILNRDAEAARQAMHDHIQQVVEDSSAAELLKEANKPNE